MGDCHITYDHHCDDKYCPSYSAWCAQCERPRRLRSNSETAEHRRRARELKSSPRKYSRTLGPQEENLMEMDEQVRCAYPSSTYHRPQFRSNQLCELPTSYITNNCQTSKEWNVSRMKPQSKPDELLYSSKALQQHQQQARARKAPKTANYNNYDNHNLSFDTGTYFDKCNTTTNLHDRYVKELESVRETMAVWKQSGKEMEHPAPMTQQLYSERLQERYVKEIEAMKIKLEEYKNTQQKCELITIGQQEIVARPNSRPRLRTKMVKLGSAGRMKKKAVAMPKVVHVVAESSDVNDDASESDEEEQIVCEENEPECLEENQVAIPTTLAAKGHDCGDVSSWPLRSSLFPHIPPYIKFSTHDAANAIKVPSGRKLFKWKLSTITPIVVRKTLVNSGFVLVRKSNQWMGTWGKHMKSPMFKTLKDSQKLNHFPGTFQLGRKDRLWRNFQRHINRFGYKEFGFIPQTYVLPAELKILKQNWEFRSGAGGDAWIIKPPASARGVGIKVINKWSHLPKKQSLVVQKYISNPYLINGSKFDLRLYVLVTSFNPLRIYLYPEGLARFASAKYSDDARDLKDRYIHLTNYSINKLSSQYTTNEDANAAQGHKWTLTKLFEFMEVNDGVDTKQLWRNLQQLVIKTIITAEAPITALCMENQLSRYNCYELFGIDVLLDENLKAWLLEVNISPSLHSASPLDAFVKGPMVQMLFDLAQFHFPSKLGHLVKQAPDCYDPKLYTMQLLKKEREKHVLFEQFEDRDDYLKDILRNLNGDDVRKLCQAEDELTVIGRFERIFPTSQTHRYLNFMENRYYNRLFDAWETKYEKRRGDGIEVLKKLCEKKVHLKVAPQSALNKSSQNTIPGCVKQVSSEEPKGEEAAEQKPLVEVMQEIKIDNNNS